jgi:hypothetical protein
MLMPKAAVNEDHSLPGRENEVGRARKFAIMQPITKAK